MKKKYMYHCTVDNHGPILTVQRRVPERGKKEPNTPRLCVSDTIPRCLAGRLFPVGKDIHVYRTDKPVRGISPNGVWDSCITDERWLIPPQKLYHVDTINGDCVKEIQAILWEVVRARRGANIRIRASYYAMLLAFLPEKYVTKRDRNWSNTVLDILGIQSDYLLEIPCS